MKVILKNQKGEKREHIIPVNFIQDAENIDLSARFCLEKIVGDYFLSNKETNFLLENYKENPSGVGMKIEDNQIFMYDPYGLFKNHPIQTYK